MSTETQTSALDAMLAQYQKNTAPKQPRNTESFKFDEKLYFSHMLKDGQTSATKTIRILPVANDTPFLEVWTHKGEVDGKSKTFACLHHLKGEPCPFCEAKQALYATGDKDDAKLAGKYAPRLTYIVKVIDRDNEADGVKFWRFNHDARKEGIMDKIYGVMNAIKKDIADAETGRDLVLTIGRNQNNIPTVLSVAQLDPSPLHTDEATKQAWLAHDKTWESVYPVKNYDYLEIVVKGGTPVWNKEEGRFVKKVDAKIVETSESETTMGIENVKESIIQSTATSTPTEATEEEDDLPF